MNYIIDPFTNQTYSIFSENGKKLLKLFIKEYYAGSDITKSFPLNKKFPNPKRKINKNIKTNTFHKLALQNQRKKRLQHLSVNNTEKKYNASCFSLNKEYNQYKNEYFNLVKQNKELLFKGCKRGDQNVICLQLQKYKQQLKEIQRKLLKNNCDLKQNKNSNQNQKCSIAISKLNSYIQKLNRNLLKELNCDNIDRNSQRNIVKQCEKMLEYKKKIKILKKFVTENCN